MTCKAKHTRYQPEDAEWLCPRCGCNSDHFIIEDPDFDAAEDCGLLHDDDFIVCGSCEYETTGKRLAAHVVRQKNLVPCPCCKGKGFVSKDKL